MVESFKQRHTLRGLVEITPQTAKIADRLLKNYSKIHVEGNSGQVAINSPGAVQVSVVNVKSKGSQVMVGPTEGSVAHNLTMRSYVEYLINRYQECQKADTSKTDRYKYMAIHARIREEFGCKWDFVPVERFSELATYLQGRINNTRLGRNRKVAGHKLFHSFEEHGTKGKNA
ncbi:MAG: hypothetical protein JNL19_12415 [Burkholderiales bacterium]|nr:hypothetical protein [Burkholderiales bacterium]